MTFDDIAKVGGHTGVFEIRDATRKVVFIGYAGGNSRMGLRGELSTTLSTAGPGARLEFRCEVNSNYLSRFQELLMVHVHDMGEPPRDNREFPGRLGVLSPLSRARGDLSDENSEE